MGSKFPTPPPTDPERRKPPAPAGPPSPMAPDTTRKAEKRKPTLAQVISVASLVLAATLYASSLAAMTAITALEAWRDGRVASAIIGASLLTGGALVAVSFCAWVYSTIRE